MTNTTTRRTRRTRNTPKPSADNRWNAYMRDVREAALLGDACDRSTVHDGDHVQRPSGYAQVAHSYSCYPRATDTWALIYDRTEHDLSLAPFTYPMVLVR